MLDALDFDSNPIAESMLQLDFLVTSLFQGIARHGMNLHIGVGAARRGPREVSRIDNNSLVHDVARKVIEFGRDNKEIRLTWHLAPIQTFHVDIRARDGWKEWVVATLLQHVLRNAT